MSEPDKVIDDGMLCHCELSGEMHVVTSKTCCELCVVTNLMPLTAENVAAALRFSKEQHHDNSFAKAFSKFCEWLDRKNRDPLSW